MAARAGVSPQYLSEVERGRKEPSSEVLAAVAGALDLTLADVTRRVTLVLDAQRPRHLSVVDGAAHSGSRQEALRRQATARRPDAVLLAA
ncbi:helix-turn-helix domain-containing protein [Georgenia sp. 1P01AC]|uniref:helix-turn-helix domain-containing protein n=1 Tax=unclassified Georgenia TaxID=2626815 RepID=UPI0039AEC9F0